MFRPVLKVGPLHFNPESRWIVPGAGAAVVYYLRLGMEDDFPSAGMEPPAKIHVLTINKKAVIERPHVLESPTADHPEAAAQDLNLSGIGIIPVHHLVTSEKTCIRKGSVELEGAEKGVAERRQRAATVLQA